MIRSRCSRQHCIFYFQHLLILVHHHCLHCTLDHLGQVRVYLSPIRVPNILQITSDTVRCQSGGHAVRKPDLTLGIKCPPPHTSLVEVVCKGDVLTCGDAVDGLCILWEGEGFMEGGVAGWKIIDFTGLFLEIH